MTAIDLRDAQTIGFKIAVRFDHPDAEGEALSRFHESCDVQGIHPIPETVRARRYEWKIETRKQWEVHNRERVGLFSTVIREREVERTIPVSDWWIVTAKAVPRV